MNPSNEGLWCIQFVETARTKSEAELQLDWLENQDGFLGGRILLPKGALDGWRTQAFFEDSPGVDEELLPNGCRRVWVPPGMAKSFLVVPNVVRREGDPAPTTL